jgi:Tol biopolymer transport system component
MYQNTNSDEAPSLAMPGKPLHPHQARNRSGRRLRTEIHLGLAIAFVALLAAASTHAQTALAESLGKSGFKIVYESYVDDNSDLYVMSGDGSNVVQLTNTPKEQEHYPQVSPDGTKLCFVCDVGEGRETVRSVYLMDIDGKNRKKVSDHAREPFWSPDGKVIGFLPQEFPKFDIIDFSTRGMSFYDLATGKVEPHVNTTNLHHLYNPTWSANGKWIAATVHAGMGFDHAILLIEAHGKKIIDLKIHGCRPCFSPDGKHLAWGPGDHELAAAPINIDADQPALGNWIVRIEDKPAKIYHIDWSPDGQFLAFSRGPDIGGDPSKPGTHQAAAEIHGVYGKGWDIGVVKTDRASNLLLSKATSADFLMLTTNGFSNKEPAWFQPRP